MWQLKNLTPFAADRIWVRDVDGREVWIVAIKATYDINANGSLRISDKQPPVHSGPVMDDDGNPCYETDLGPAKNLTDILLLGHACAPEGIPVQMLQIGFGIGKLTRTALVTGDRVWQQGLLFLKPGEPQPFKRMPLSWLRAVGGNDQTLRQTTGNPIGCGLQDEAHTPLPNIENIEQPLSSPHERPLAAGFGPVPCHWPWRARYAGTYDKTWESTRAPLLPTDFDPRYWQVAPPQQQYPGKLRGGEPVVLVNLVPPEVTSRCTLRFNLPRLSFGCMTSFYDGDKIDTRPSIHTVILEPDYPRVSIVYHMALQCHSKVNLLEETIVILKKRINCKIDPIPAKPHT